MLRRDMFKTAGAGIAGFFLLPQKSKVKGDDKVIRVGSVIRVSNIEPPCSYDYVEEEFTVTAIGEHELPDGKRIPKIRVSNPSLYKVDGQWYWDWYWDMPSSNRTCSVEIVERQRQRTLTC